MINFNLKYLLNKFVEAFKPKVMGLSCLGRNLMSQGRRKWLRNSEESKEFEKKYKLKATIGALEHDELIVAGP